MKNILVTLCLLSFFLLLPSFIFAQTITPNPSDAVVTVVPTPMSTTVDYTLPYPGLLPNNPFYKLKTLRDRLVGFLISDPLKKVQFDLLQADKRLSASYALWQQKPSEEQLIIDTLSKGNNYFFDALSQEQLAAKQGILISDINNTLYTSARKHEEVLHSMIQSASPSLKRSLQQEYLRTVQFEKMVSMQKKK